jgi:CRP-like cAMP-binding protein
VFLLPKKQFDCLLQEQAFRRDFIAMLLSKQRYLAERIFRLSALDVEQRFFHFLREHYGEREEYSIDISKRDFAAAIDALPETLSRLLLKLKEEGAVQWEGESLRVRKGFWNEREAQGSGD